MRGGNSGQAVGTERRDPGIVWVRILPHSEHLVLLGLCRGAIGVDLSLLAPPGMS